MKIQPIHVGQADVDDDASWFVDELRRQKIARRRVGTRVKPHRLEQLLQRTAHGRVVVDNVHHRSLARRQRHCTATRTMNRSTVSMTDGPKPRYPVIPKVEFSAIAPARCRSRCRKRSYELRVARAASNKDVTSGGPHWLQDCRGALRGAPGCS